MANLSHGSLTAIREPRGYKPASRGCPAWLLARLKAEQELRYWPRPWASVSQCLTALGLPESRFQGWRFTDYVLGHFRALPETRGRLCLTDGHMAIIWDRRNIYRGLIQNFVHDNNLDDDSDKAAKAKTKKHDAVFAALMEDFDV
jgi:hypothetical protein